MIPRKVIVLTCALLFYLNGVSQQVKILAGPMLGYCEHKEVQLWLMTTGAHKLTVKYCPEKNSKNKETVDIELFQNAKDPQRFLEEKISKITIKDLDPGTRYTYSIFLDGKEQKSDYALAFITREIWEWRAPAPDFKFIAGSCNYVNDSFYDRPGKPYGQSTTIFNTMANASANLMIWLGDNTYLREADYSSESGIAYRYAHTRKEKNMQRFLATQANYAMWDDHDFGPDDASRSYGLKEVTKKTFLDYWGNKIYGENGKGLYSKVSYADCEFYLTDDRTFRDDSKENETFNPAKTLLGEQQLSWLKNELVTSRATFKFVCMGGQFLNEHTESECYFKYRAERQHIIDFITANKIGGVIFISGDRHHSEVIKKERAATKKTPGSYTLYDITSSPLTSGVDNILNKPEKENPMRVDGTLAVTQNFCLFSISGMPGERKVFVRCIDKDNKTLWEQTLYQKDLSDAEIAVSTGKKKSKKK